MPALPDEAAVVRYGRLLRQDLEISAANEYDHSGVHGLSVFTGRDLAVEEILARHPLPHRVYRASSVGTIRSAGYQVAPTGEVGHALIVFQGMPTADDWVKLNAAFGPPMPNPAARLG